MKSLSSYFELRRRYFRSINLERDLMDPEAVSGYVITPRTTSALERILTSVCAEDKANRAWTVTGAYGSGKSAFAQFLACLFGSSNSRPTKEARKILASCKNKKLQSIIKKNLLDKAVIRAAVAGRREPISVTVVRALESGCSMYWSDSGAGRRPLALNDLNELSKRVAQGKPVGSAEVLKVVRELAEKYGLLIIIDELGKNLEYIVHKQDESDLFLLQELAELPSETGGPGVYVLGLLHQGFVDYAHSLSSIQRGEWAKVQGRFEDIPFTGSTHELVRLTGQVINPVLSKAVSNQVDKLADSWHEHLTSLGVKDYHSKSDVASIIPLHPVSALALPILSSRYAQNDRSMFSFLTGNEPYSFAEYLKETEIDSDCIPLLKPYQLYDYFVESAGATLYSRPHLQRWVEVQSRIADARHLSQDSQNILKTIGLLNLISSSGVVKASRKLVISSLVDSPNFSLENWEKEIDKLIEDRIVLDRKHLDELRLWEGSDFDIEAEIQRAIESQYWSTKDVLDKFLSWRPQVASRHSYETGTLRFFEKRFIENEEDLLLPAGESDGVLAYWIGSSDLPKVPSFTSDDKPIVLVKPDSLTTVHALCQELAAVRSVISSASELQTDGVARKELRLRVQVLAEQIDLAVKVAFNVSPERPVWVFGKKVKLQNEDALLSELSAVFDTTYDKSLVLWNELINRRLLTSQGAKARRMLIEAMIQNWSEPRLSLTGNGPECSIYASVLANTGIHSHRDEGWSLGRPSDEGVIAVWDAIEEFCAGSVSKPRTLDQLYEILEAKPYGVKSGVIPVLLTAVIIARSDDVCLYKDGSFVPILGPEHFELLVKDASRFAVKHFLTEGLRAQVFVRLDELFRAGSTKDRKDIRNSNLLEVVRPLVKFGKKLQPYSRTTKELSKEAIALRTAILESREPDELLFTNIPKALGLEPITAEASENGEYANEFKEKLRGTLREIQMAYDKLLANCTEVISVVFDAQEDNLRSFISERASRLVPWSRRSPFESFIHHAIDTDADDQEWIERLVMVVSDKPTDAWDDEDRYSFEIKAQDFARRFRNFESLHAETSENKDAKLEASRIAVTAPDGTEVHKVIWLDKARSEQVENLANEILTEKLSQYPELRESILSKLAEKLLSEEEPVPEQLRSK